MKCHDCGNMEERVKQLETKFSLLVEKTTTVIEYLKLKIKEIEGGYEH